LTVGLGGEQIEGRRAVRELLSAGRRPVREVWMAEGLDDASVVADISALARGRGVPLRTVARSRLESAARTDAPQGVLAFATSLPEARLEELVRRDRAGTAPFLLVLDGVTDPHNLGALLRTAECAGATGAVLPRRRAAHVTPTVTKAAAGAIEHLPIAVVAGIAGALRALADAGVWTVGLDAGARMSLWDLELAPEPVALVLGGEGRGLSRLVRTRCDVLVAIPQRGAIESLNVGAAGALACFEVARRRA
jgi:23S rRNA (guanosine2251-2'-O)-methyltransferase